MQSTREKYTPSHPPYRLSSHFLRDLVIPRDGRRTENALSAGVIPGEPPLPRGRRPHLIQYLHRIWRRRKIIQYFIGQKRTRMRETSKIVLKKNNEPHRKQSTCSLDLYRIDLRSKGDDHQNKTIIYCAGENCC